MNIEVVKLLLAHPDIDVNATEEVRYCFNISFVLYVIYLAFGHYIDGCMQTVLIYVFFNTC